MFPVHRSKSPNKILSINLLFDVFTYLFEKLTIPILLYGSQIWGYENTKQVQVMCNNVMRTFDMFNNRRKMFGALDAKF